MPTTVTYRARFLWCSPGRYFAPGELRVAGGRVVGVGPARGGRIPTRAIFPGLVDAHVHLQIPPLKSPRRKFLPWVRAVMRQQRQRTPADHLAEARSSLRQLLAGGVCAVGEIDSSGVSPGALRELPVGGACYQELTGFHLRGPGARLLVETRRIAGTRHCRGGLSPHAPYSVSPELFRAALATRRPLAVHAAETEEELCFLQSGTGPFRDLLAELGRLPPGFRPPQVGAIAYLERLGVLTPRTTLIHAHHMTLDEAVMVRRRGTRVVVCPGTIRYFRRSTPPVARWLALGIPVALGTDSRASNDNQSLRHEMVLARRIWPELAPEQVLAMATTNGGAALGSASAGRLRPGGAANFVTVPWEADAASCIEAFTSGELETSGVWLRGAKV